MRPGTNDRLQSVSSRFGTPAVREWWLRMPPELHCRTVQPRSPLGLSHCFQVGRELPCDLVFGLNGRVADVIASSMVGMASPRCPSAQYARARSLRLVRVVVAEYTPVVGEGGFVEGNRFVQLSRHSVGAREVVLDSDGAIAGAEFLEQQVQAGVIGLTGDYQEIVDVFVDGTQPYWLTGPWVLDSLNDSEMNWGVVPIPTMDGNVPGPFVGVSGFFLGAYGD